MIFPELCGAVSHLLPKIHDHQFNKNLCLGTLPKKIFRFYLEQDALYLSDFSRALMLTSNRLSTDKHITQFKRLSHEILDTERNLHFKYLGELRSPGLFGARNISLEKISVVADYTQHLLRTASDSPVEEAVASFIPCFWIYGDLGKKMLSMPNYNASNPYHAWISSYSNNQFTSAGKSIVETAEELVSTISCAVKKNNVVSAFVKSTEYELLFLNHISEKMEDANALQREHQFKAR